MVRPCDAKDFEAILAVIHDGARRYRGIIPPDRCPEPYMSREELQQQMADGVVFWAEQEAGELAGVMGLQRVLDVTLIRHAYVRTASQGQGVGGRLLAHLRGMATTPVLLGTWADAVWAIQFYRKHGFEVVPPDEKERLLRTYWQVPERQIETSVVLADAWWRMRAAD